MNTLTHSLLAAAAACLFTVAGAAQAAPGPEHQYWIQKAMEQKKARAAAEAAAKNAKCESEGHEKRAEAPVAPAPSSN